MDRSRVVLDFCCKGPNPGFLAHLAEAEGARVYHCPLKATHLSFIQGLGKILRSGGYHIVHNHLETYAGIGVYAAKRCGVSVITGFHNTAFPAQMLPDYGFLHKIRDLYGRFSISYALHHSDLVTGCSQAVINFLKEAYGLPNDKARVIYYGVELPFQKSMEQRQAFRNQLGLGNDKVIITHVGRFLPQKNHVGLVRVAEKVVAKDPRAHFILVGDGPLRPQIEEEVQKLRLAPYFSFLGIRTDVEDILGFSDIFFLPSKWEGFGLVVLEAMAAGLPIVASDLPVLRESVENGVNGYLRAVVNENSLAQKLLDLMADPDKRRAMGNCGRQIVERKFSIETSARNLCELYESLCDPERQV